MKTCLVEEIEYEASDYTEQFNEVEKMKYKDLAKYLHDFVFSKISPTIYDGTCYDFERHKTWKIVERIERILNDNKETGYGMFCPKCRTGVLKYLNGHLVKYCPWCGEELKW